MESEWSRGNRVGAMSASRTAKNWGIAGIITGSFSAAGVIILSIIVNVTAASSSSNDDYWRGISIQKQAREKFCRDFLKLELLFSCITYSNTCML